MYLVAKGLDLRLSHFQDPPSPSFSVYLTISEFGSEGEGC